MESDEVMWNAGARRRHSNSASPTGGTGDLLGSRAVLAHMLHGSCPRSGICAGRPDAFADGDPLVTTCADADGARLAHDLRGAPYASDALGAELTDLLVSITDEDDVRLLAWARPSAGAGICGLGIDLCALDDFRSDPLADRFARLVLTPGEFEMTERHAAGRAFARAAAFSAKEAAFKATAWALRRWYERHDQTLAFEVRDFETGADGRVRGTARGGRAAVACSRMGIARIDVEHVPWHDMVLSVAVAWAS